MTVGARQRLWVALAAVLLVACEGKVVPGPPFSHYAEDPTPLRLVQVLDGKADAERRRILEAALTTHGIPYREQFYAASTGPGVNVEIALGHGPAELVIAAHYDRVPQAGGANDNASCAAAAIDGYRALKNGGPLKNITLRIVFFDDEENGIVGSLAYVHKADLGVIKGALSLELCGIGDAVGIWDIHPGVEDALIVQALKAAGKLEGVYVGTHGPVPRFSSDHVRFHDRGVPAVGVTLLPRQDEQTLRDYVADPNSIRWLFRWMRPKIFRTYHSPGDDAATIEAEALAIAARIIVRAVREFDRLIGEGRPSG